MPVAKIKPTPLYGKRSQQLSVQILTSFVWLCLVVPILWNSNQGLLDFIMLVRSTTSHMEQVCLHIYLIYQVDRGNDQ